MNPVYQTSDALFVHLFNTEGVGPCSAVVVSSARDREVAGSNPPAVLPILCPWERHFTRLSSLHSGENEYLASARAVLWIGR